MTPNLFSFYAQTESGLRVELFWTIREVNYSAQAPIDIGVRTELYSHPCAGKFARNRKDGRVYLSLIFGHVNERLLGYPFKGFLALQDFNQEELDNAVQAAIQLHEDRMTQEIATVRKSDPVTLFKRRIGHIARYGLKHANLSLDSSYRFEESVRAIDRIIKFERQEGGGDEYFKCTYGVYLDLREKAAMTSQGG